MIEPSVEVKGLVIREGLRGGELPRRLAPFLAHRYSYALGGVREVEILVLRLEARLISEAAFLLAEALAPSEYYAHFVSPARLWIVFPGTIAIADRGDAAALDRCRILGRSYGVPEEQMPFESMFEVDHPNAH